ncbi:hypothetical protein F443_14874, partial [Phytophthora nicotianae P1569]
GSLNVTNQHSSVIWRAAVLGWFLLLRRSEYLALGNKVHQFALNAAEVRSFKVDGTQATSFGEIQFAVIRFRGDKTDQFRQGNTRAIGRSGRPWLCPIHGLWYLSLHHKNIRLP